MNRPGLAPDRVPLLAAVPAFAALDEAAIADLASVMREVVLPSDTILAEEGEAGDDLFVVLRGRMVAETADARGQARVLSELVPGDIAGEVAALIGGRRTATLRSVDATVLALLDLTGIRELGERRPEVIEVLRELSAARLRRSELASYLLQLFGTFDAAALDELQASVSPVHVPAGDVLFRQGDPGDAVYVVLAGRLRAVVSDGDAGNRAPADMGRGDTVGELALLTHGRRSATVYAVRDSHLARLATQQFDALMARHPAAMAQISRLVAERLLRATSAPPARQRPASAVAVVPITGGVAAEEFARGVAPALATPARVRVVCTSDVAAALGPDVLDARPGDPHGNWLTHWLDELEASNDVLVCVADERFPAWTDRCVRRSDHVLLLADAGADPTPGELERGLAPSTGPVSPARTLVFLHAEGAGEALGTARWLRDRDVAMHLHVRRGTPADLERVGRIVGGRAVSVVLGGGGARGLAHIGVLQAMEEAGIPIDMVGGTSMGAAIAAGPALGWTAAQLRGRARPLTRRLFDVTLPLVSLVRGRSIGRAIRELVGEREIEDARIPYFCVSTNLTRADEVVHRRGRMAMAIRASLSLPGVLPPVHFGGDLLVDGGLLDNVPIDVMRATNNGGRVIAVDVSPTVDIRVSRPFEPDISGWRVLAARLAGRRAARLRLPSILTLLNRAAVAASVHRRDQQHSQRQADLYLQIPTAEWGFLEFEAIDALAARGYQASIEPLRAWWEAEQQARAAEAADRAPESPGAEPHDPA